MSIGTPLAPAEAKRPALRLHVEPKPAETSRADPRRLSARRALLILAGLAVLAQPLSVPWLHHSLTDVYEGIDAHTQWAAYQAAAAPDVLYLGGSNARMDVDTGALEAAFSTAAGKRVSVGKLGVNAAQFDFLDVLTYRVLARSSLPRTIVFIVSATQFNANFRCPTCGGGDQLSVDLWEISDPPSAGFVSRALKADPQPWKLAAGLVAPAFTYYREEAAGLECPLLRWGRGQIAQGRLPSVSPLTTPTLCDLAPRPRPDEVLTADQAPAVAALYRDAFVGDFAFSERQAGYLGDMVAQARAAGVRPVLMILPELGLKAIAPEPNALFDAGIRALAGSLDTPLVDLSEQLNDQPRLWTDQLHLNRWGAQALAPRLAVETARVAAP